MFPQATRSPNFPAITRKQRPLPIGVQIDPATQETTMKKIIVLLAVAFALAIGTATMVVHLRPAIAEPCSNPIEPGYC
jgi:hypothetical protein